MNEKMKSTDIENKEWIESLEWVIDHESEARASDLLSLLIQTAGERNIDARQGNLISDYVNTISTTEETSYPGNLDIEKRIQNAISWNAMAMVVKANQRNEGIGGHISTYSSASMLFEVGFNHFFRGYDKGQPDIVYFQGHAAPGVYARSYVEHRFDEHDLLGFRREVFADHGLPSYPHPKALPEYWRFPTVSMGLAPIQAIYMARHLKHTEHLGLSDRTDQKVWAFLGDGEMDEPESTGALSTASGNHLDNLIFVISCNLQRLDGPVRGNTKIVNELEGIFRGAGWNVIKLLWGGGWDALFEKDGDRSLVERLNTIPDGHLQKLAQLDGKSFRQELANDHNGLEELLDNVSDEELEALVRGGHDPVKVYNAYQQAVRHADGPTVILAQTVKGFRQSDAGEASNVTHQKKKLNLEELKTYRDTLELPIKDKELEKNIPFYRFKKESEEFKYLSEARKKLHGWLPMRKNIANKINLPDQKLFREFYEGSEDKDATTTGAFIQMLSKLLEDKSIGDNIIPIIPDESRTFGLDALFSKAGIYSPKGQKYEPVDKGSLLYYNEMKQGKIIEEGISEAGAMATFMATGNNHIIRDFYTVPMFIFYSMFGFQRIGDLIWAAADAGVKGFLIGGISGRTSLSGEGLQHTDGQSHLYALAYPNLKAYDPAFAYEIAVIINEGLKRMYGENRDIFYYLTVTNQSYPMPSMPQKSDVKQGILDGIYLFKKSRKRKNKKLTVNLMGSGAIMAEVQKAAEILEKQYQIPANIWSVTSYKGLYDQAIDFEKENRSASDVKLNRLQKILSDHGDFFIAASDYVRALPYSIAKWIPGEYEVLGTDGFGVSDTVPDLRKHFQVDARHIASSALSLLRKNKLISKTDFKAFMKTLLNKKG